MTDLMGKRKYFFALSLLIIIAGIAGFLINGLELDIQFQGGTIIKIEMADENFDADTIGTELSGSLGKIITAQKSKTFNPENPVDMIDMLVLKVSSEETLTSDELGTVYEILENKFAVDPNAQKDERIVAPFIGKELMSKGVQAVLIASVLIILYVWWRFSVMSGLPAALAAIIALLHDALVMFSVYSLFRIPLNEAFVAAVLTILGYSMNDTIIIYDRIRENSGLVKKASTKELVNKSVLQSLSRSVNTLITTLVCVLTVFIFASINNISSLKEFTLPLLIGLISGTYSSIFIASPLWMMWKDYKLKRRVHASRVK
jgi:preprotein translocase subunit SecF